MRYDIVGVDVDEVLANLHEPWTLWLEERHGITDIDWSDWHIDRSTGLGSRVFDFITPDIYLDDTVVPYPDAYLAMDRLRDAGATIWYTTSCIRGTEEAKLEWLKGYGIWQEGDVYKPGRDKAYPALDLLIDDRYKNVKDAACPAILISREWNEKYSWYWRADDVSHAVDQAIEEDKYAFLR